MVNLGYFMAKVRQRVCHYKRKFGGISFFFYQKKVGGTVAQRGFLDYKCWYKRIIAVPRRQFLVAQRGTNGVFISFFVNMTWHSQISVDFTSFFRNVLGTRDPFCFFENFFAQIFHYAVYT